MPRVVTSFRAQAEAQVAELMRAIQAAESVIIATIERECEALRGGRLLAANALRVRLRDAAKLYLDLTRASRASLSTMGHLLPGTERKLRECRSDFGSMLRIELATLAAERAAAMSSLNLGGEIRPAPAMVASHGPRRRVRIRRAG